RGVDVEILVAERLDSQFVQRVGSVGDQLTQEDVLVRIDRMDHQLEQLAGFRLELECLGLACHNFPLLTGSPRGSIAKKAGRTAGAAGGRRLVMRWHGSRRVATI